MGTYLSKLGERDSKSEFTQSCLTFATPRTVARPGPSVHGDFPGKNTGVGCHFLRQGIFLSRGLSPGLLPLQADALPFAPPGKFRQVEGIAMSTKSWSLRGSSASLAGCAKCPAKFAAPLPAEI